MPAALLRTCAQSCFPPCLGARYSPRLMFARRIFHGDRMGTGVGVAQGVSGVCWRSALIATLRMAQSFGRIRIIQPKTSASARGGLSSFGQRSPCEPAAVRRTRGSAVLACPDDVERPVQFQLLAMPAHLRSPPRWSKTLVARPSFMAASKAARPCWSNIAVSRQSEQGIGCWPGSTPASSFSLTPTAEQKVQAGETG